ncbi:hypothetical protein PCC9214_00556 [Planktothrix tepida]|uniref:Uncharacterized protein n=2 Tax=Planktothrix TaxID=54304 RepID=A0A1J1LEH0_9CYAN|nr:MULTISPECIES: hypothetical protein [Planktothrix]CAD5919344.1 hypothetical protein PCC9214_00556 [Planktothrix tepida]CAD5984031.1 hypothetical protein NO713_05241 [Planktothrix pseudagardhii]CUR30848.1 conserved exported hypothetical protein [Planktothrix tepida PCC 9214]
MQRFNGSKRLSLSLITGGISLILSLPTLAEPERKIIGNCEPESCETLWKILQSNFSEKTQSYQKDCLPPQLLGLSVNSNSDQQKVVYLSCWEAKVENGERPGLPLGILPLPGYEQQFGVKISSDDPQIQAILNRNTEQVERMSFECGTYGGDINILVSEDQKVSLQCYFQAGANLFDSNADGVPDGMYGKGTGVDFTEDLKN